MSKQKVSLTVPIDHIAKVDEIAESRRRSRSFIISEAIEKYLTTQTNGTKTVAKKKGATR